MQRSGFKSRNKQYKQYKALVSKMLGAFLSCYGYY